MSDKLFYCLARDSLKHNRSRTKATLFTAVIVIVILCSASIIFDSYTKIFSLNKQKEFGHWNIGVYQEQDLDLDDLYTYDQTGNIIELGNSDSGHCIGMIDENAMELCNMALATGSMPQNVQETAVTRDFLEINGYSDELGQMIDVKYYDNTGTLNIKKMRLSGVFKDFNLNTSINIPAVVFKYDDSITKYNQSTVIMQNGQQKNERIGYDIYNEQIQLSAAEKYMQRAIDSLIYIVTLLVSGVIIYGTTFASLKTKKQEYVLLRGIGATKKQLRKIIKYEAVLILVIAVPLGIMISFGMTYLIMMSFPLNKETVVYAFTWTSLIWRIITAAIVILIGIIKPLSKASKHALSGSFSNQEFKYFESRFKKLRRQNCFYLAYRQLSSNKKIAIFLMIVLAVSMNRTTKLAYDYEQVKNAYQQVEKHDYSFGIYNSSKNGISSKVIDQLANYGQDIKMYQYQSCLMDNNNDIALYAITDGNFDFNSLTGSLATNADEIVIIKQKFFDSYQQKLSDEFFSQYQIGDQITITDNQNTITVKIVGMIETGDDKNSGAIKGLVNKEFFSTYFPAMGDNIFHLTIKAKDYRSYVKLQKQITNISNRSDSLYGIDNYLQDQENYDQVRNEFIESLSYVLSVLVISFFLFYYINRLTLMSNQHELGILKSIGASNRQLCIIQIYKCLIISSLAIIFSQWSIVYQLYHETNNFDLVIKQGPLFVDCIFLIIVISIIAVTLPLRQYTKTNIIDLVGRIID